MHHGGRWVLSIIDLKYGLYGKTCAARWYPRPDRVTIHLNKMISAESAEDLNIFFLAELCALEFHELGHIYGYRSGCKNGCKSGNCYWCNYVEQMILFFIDNYTAMNS